MTEYEAKFVSQGIKINYLVARKKWYFTLIIWYNILVKN
jgi:hypothetical protein